MSWKFGFLLNYIANGYKIQKQPPRGVLIKRCSENMQQIYRRTTIRNCAHFSMSVLLQMYSYFQNTFSKKHLWVAASKNKGEGVVDLGSIIRIFCFCWSFIGYYGNLVFKKYLMKNLVRFSLTGPDLDYVVPLRSIFV